MFICNKPVVTLNTQRDAKGLRQFRAFKNVMEKIKDAARSMSSPTDIRNENTRYRSLEGAFTPIGEFFWRVMHSMRCESCSRSRARSRKVVSRPPQTRWSRVLFPARSLMWSLRLGTRCETGALRSQALKTTRQIASTSPVIRIGTDTAAAHC